MKVTKKEDIINGLKRLGLFVEVAKTKVPEWERIHVHEVIRPATTERLALMRYVCKISIHHGMLHSYTVKGLPGYFAFAIKLMLTKAKILNMVNFYTLGVKAYNQTYHLKELAEMILDDESIPKKERQKRHHKAMLHFHWEKQKLFTSLFTERYYAHSDAIKVNNYAV